MVHFNYYLREKLTNSGYGQVLKHDTENDLFLASPQNDRIWVCYLDKPIEPEMIRRYLEFPGHVLFVVDEKLIPDTIASRKETPMWLRVLHGLYMGRIYVWNGRHLFGLHFDYDSGDVSESGIIQPDELLLTETGTWLRGWTGQYKLARFNDKRWWDEPVEQRQSKTDWKTDPKTGWAYTDPGQKNSDARQAYEDARDHYWEQQRAREQQANNQQYQWINREPPKQPDSKPDFMTQFARAGNKDAVKVLYKELAKRFHPDMNPGIDTTQLMQEINAAYEVYK